MKHLSRYASLLLSISVVIGLLLSCSKEERDKTINSQEESISTYIRSNFKDYTVILREGSNRIIVDPGHSIDSLAFGDSLVFYYAGYTFNNGPSSLFATNDQTVADKNNFNITAQEDTFKGCSVLFDSGSFIPGLVNGLYGVTEGEHCIIVFSARYGFGSKPVANVPALSALIYEVWIDKIKKNN